MGEHAGSHKVRRDDSPERVLHQRVPVHRLLENPHLQNGEWTAQESRWIDLPAVLAAERSDRESHDFVGGRTSMRRGASRRRPAPLCNVVFIEAFGDRVLPDLRRAS